MESKYSFILGILAIIGLWKIFTKAGKPGWAAIIPIYNIYVLLQIINKPWWWLLLLLIPGVNIVFAIWMLNRLSKSFGQGVGFTIVYFSYPLSSSWCWDLVHSITQNLQVK